MPDQATPKVGPPLKPLVSPTVVSPRGTVWVRGWGWTGSHLLIFFLSASLVSLLFNHHPRVGRVWGIFLHLLLPGAVGSVQWLWLRGSVRNSWLWIAASILGLLQCLIFSEGWGVLSVLGFGMGVLQATVVRPWGLRFALLWMTLSGSGWMLAWQAAPALDRFSAGWLVDRVTTDTPPPWEMALAGLVYGLFTSPILLYRPCRTRGTVPIGFDRFPGWLPFGMVSSMMIVTFFFGVHFGRMMAVRNALITFIFGFPDPTWTRWADLLIVLVPFLSGEIAYRWMTWIWSSKWISFRGAISFLAPLRGVVGLGRRHR